jgi:hypothetical protein
MEREFATICIPESFPPAAKELVKLIYGAMRGRLGPCTNEDVILAGCTIAANVIAQSGSTDEARGAGLAFATTAMETIVSDAVEMERLMREAERQLGRPIEAEELPDIDDTPDKAALTTALTTHRRG